MKARIVLAALSLVLVCLGTSARTLEDIRKDKKLVVATEGQFPPFNYFQGGKLAGFEIELTELLAAKMGLQVEWKSLGFDALLAGLRQDRWDLVIASHTITDERSKAVTFTEPHYCTGGVIVATDPAINGVADVAGRVVAVQTGSTYVDTLKKLGSAKELKTFPQDTDARNALTARRVDIWVTDHFVAKQVAAANPSLNLNLGRMISIDRIAAAVAKGNAPLAHAYNAALAESLRDGTYAALSKRLFNDDIRCKWW
jgi:polar amino acid transport system substrate-binding protein